MISKILIQNWRYKNANLNTYYFVTMGGTILVALGLSLFFKKRKGLSNGNPDDFSFGVTFWYTV
jgi:LPXTG-motif cell wall-anchored protein